MVATLLATAALAGPLFEGAPGDVETAVFAWERAVDCAGWEARAHPVVRIERVDPGSGYAGMAFVDPEGLFLIRIRPEVTHPSVLWHEVAHAWANGPPFPLTEGRAELLAACIGGSTPRTSRLRRSELRPQGALPLWAQVRSDDVSLRRGAYDTATRLVMAAAEGVPVPHLFPRRGPADWVWFEAMLREQSPVGRGFWEAIALLGPQSSLWDLDDDGVSNFGEHRRGTDPFRWDSDGDGWWDGGRPPRNDAVPLAPGPEWTCSGWATGPEPATLYVGRPEGFPEGAEVDLGYGHGIPAPWREGGRRVPAHRPILVRTSWPEHLDGPHRHWVVLRGAELVPDPGCRAAAPWVTWDASLPGADDFLEALASAGARADVLLGPSERRLEVIVGGERTWWEEGRVRLGTSDLGAAWTRGRYDVLAAHAVAMARVWEAPDILADLDLVESLAWALVEDPVPTAFSPFNTGTWTRAARGCPDGWWGVVHGFCAVEGDGGASVE